MKSTRYTYKWVEPSCTPPFKKSIRYTRGRYVCTTDPCGPFGFRYAVFRNKSSEVWVPVHDLTDETKVAIAKAEQA